MRLTNPNTTTLTLKKQVGTRQNELSDWSRHTLHLTLKCLISALARGKLSTATLKKGATVIGLDHDESILTVAEPIVGEKGLLETSRYKTKELPIADLKESVDATQAVGVLRVWEDLPKVLEQVHGSLKRKRRVCIHFRTGWRKTPRQVALRRCWVDGFTATQRGNTRLVGKLAIRPESEAYAGYEREDGEVPYSIFLAQKQAETLTSKPEIESYKGNWFNLQRANVQPWF